MARSSSSEPPEEHGLYPIRTVSQMTGVNPITLRAWERRYGLIKPLRTEKGHRLYTAQDIADIQRVVELLEHGMSIGQVPALLDRSSGVVPVLRASPASDEGRPVFSAWQDAYRSALARLDEHGLDALEADALAFATPDQLLERQLLPLLDGMESARQHDAAVDAQYHLLKNRVAAALIRGSGHHRRVGSSRKVLVAALPPERGVFGVKRLTWGLQRAHIPATLLGSGVPANSLLAAARMHASRAMVLLFEHKLPAAICGTQIPLLAEAGCPVIAVGPQAQMARDVLEKHSVRVGPGTHSMDEAIAFIRGALQSEASA